MDFNFKKKKKSHIKKNYFISTDILKIVWSINHDLKSKKKKKKKPHQKNIIQYIYK
jgi:hypothetical protein